MAEKALVICLFSPERLDTEKPLRINFRPTGFGNHSSQRLPTNEIQAFPDMVFTVTGTLPVNKRHPGPYFGQITPHHALIPSLRYAFFMAKTDMAA